MQEHKELQELCNLVKDCKSRKMLSEDIVQEIIQKYGFYLTHLTYIEYVAWLRSDRKLAKIYF